MSRVGRGTAALTRRNQRARVWVSLAGVGALALVVIVLLSLRAPEPPSVEVTGDDPWLGNETAGVTAFYYADFQCPWCARFDRSGDLDRIVAAYGEDVRLVFKDFPIVGEDSWTAARASTFVWESTPSAYWAWRETVFDAQGGENDGWASADELALLSRRVAGVDADGLAELLGTRDDRSEATGDLEDGRAAGVRGTPTIVVGGKALSALDSRGVNAAIEEAIASARAAPQGT